MSAMLIGKFSLLYDKRELLRLKKWCKINAFEVIKDLHYCYVYLHNIHINQEKSIKIPRTLNPKNWRLRSNPLACGNNTLICADLGWISRDPPFTFMYKSYCQPAESEKYRRSYISNLSRCTAACACGVSKGERVRTHYTNVCREMFQLLRVDINCLRLL